ncbi:MAG TPA: hypothetical protein VHV08_16585, partial [Pirellulales bacterium]|nr:hypothetical protein [Pirellulales bacterium]
MKWLLSSSAVCATALLACQIRPAAADEKPASLQALVTTADDEQISAVLAGFADGKLTLATDPARSVDLVDLERIELGKIAPTAGDVAWIGQDNHDLVQVGGVSGGNGIQDLHLRAGRLRPLALKQVLVVCRFPKQLRVWRLDTSQSPHWRLAVARDEVAPQADLYLEPAGDDSFGKTFDLTFTYGDGSTSKSSVTATTHSSDQLKLDGTRQAAPAITGGPAPAARAEITLIDRGRLQGELTALGADSLVLRTVWQDDFQVPIVQIAGLWFGNALPSNPSKSLDKQACGYEHQLAHPGAEDVVFLVAPDKSAAQVAGNVLGLADGKLTLRFEGADRSIKQDRLLGVVFAQHP